MHNICICLYLGVVDSNTSFTTSTKSRRTSQHVTRWRVSIVFFLFRQLQRHLLYCARQGNFIHVTYNQLSVFGASIIGVLRTDVAAVVNENRMQNVLHAFFF